MKKLYFTRHGQSVLNVAGRFGGHTDTPLTDKGRQQAKQAARAAKNYKIDIIVSSPLSRAHETAQIIASELGYSEDKIHINKLFMERNFGSMEGELWSPELDLESVSDIEAVDALLERARLAHDFLHTLNADNILVVSHGSFGRALRSIILPEHIYRNKSTGGSKKHDGLPNAEIVCWIDN